MTHIKQRISHKLSLLQLQNQRKLTRADTVFLSRPLKVLKESTASAPAFYKHIFRIEQTSHQCDLTLTSVVSGFY